MHFDELEREMRVYETAHDHRVLPGMYMVARVDGRGFGRFFDDVQAFKAPFDERFRDLMVETTRHLMDCGFRVLYGYTQSDEISLLFRRDEASFDRKIRKYNSVLAGEASAKFSLELGELASFDCRLMEFPEASKVVGYFRWRSDASHRNALHAHCYSLLRRKGQGAREATARLSGLSSSEKREFLLNEGGVAFDTVPTWHRGGIGLYWETVESGTRQLRTDQNLPSGDPYSDFVAAVLDDGLSGEGLRALGPSGDTTPWQLWYNDTFDSSAPSTIDKEGSGLLEGLQELWAHHLFERVRKGGGRGFSSYNLACGDIRCFVDDGWTSDDVLAGSVRLRDWMFGEQVTTKVGYVAAADRDLLHQVAKAHASLLPSLGREASGRILESAAKHKTRERFLEALRSLLPPEQTQSP